MSLVDVSHSRAAGSDELVPSRYAVRVGDVDVMVISDGDKRYETFLSSDFQGNATIRLKLRRNSVVNNN